MKPLIFFLLISSCSAKWPAYLEHFKEPIIEQLGEAPADYYRLIICPTFSEPYLFSFKVTGENSGIFKAKILSGKGGYKVGTLELEKSFVIQGDEFRLLIERLRTPHSKTPFFGLPEGTDDVFSGLDGSRAIFEGVESQKTFHSDLWSPEHCELILSMAGLEKDPSYRRFHESIGPYFRACHALMQTARSRIKWSSEMGEDFRNFSRAQVVHHSPSYREAYSILHQEKEADTNDPFAPSETIPTSVAEHKKARELLTKALLDVPGSFIIHQELAYSHLDSKQDFKSSIHHFTEALKSDPLNENLISARGYLFLEIGETSKAKIALARLQHLESRFAKELAESISKKK